MTTEGAPKLKTDTVEGKEKLSFKVLLAEDSEIQRKLIQEILEDKGYKVVAVENGQLLIELLDGNESFDLIISDNSMPIKKGIVALKEIKSNEKLKKIPFILISGDFDSGEKLKLSALELGAFAFLEKPFLEEDFYNAVDKAMEQTESLK